MEAYFAVDYQGKPFVLFGPAHLAVVAVVILLSLAIYLARNRFTKRSRKGFAILFCSVILGGELSWHAWRLATGTWNANAMLPLWLCSLTSWTMPLTLLLRRNWHFQFLYPLGFIGAWMALLQPDLMQYGFPHFRFIQFTFVHGTLVLAIVFAIFGLGFRPQIRWFPRILLWFNLYWLFCAFINPLVGGNYLYTAGKLPTPSLLDYLGPWPFYLLAMEVLGILLCLIAYLPFIISSQYSKLQPGDHHHA